MIQLPIEYTTSYFFEYAGYPDKTATGYRASCPMCMEGKSWGEKKRLYYFPNDRYFFCHNGCGSFSDYYWVKTVSGKQFSEIKEEIEVGYDTSEFQYEHVTIDNEKSLIAPQPLPKDSINLMDKTQLLFYKDNYWVKQAVAFLRRRQILKAEYRPKAFYLSLNDYVHKNRLTIPFYDENGQVEFYQSRALSAKQEGFAKFLSKLNSDKSIFNLDRIDYELDYIFIMEGAIDAMFLPNAVAISGVYLTDYQDELLRRHCPFLKKVWVFDNPKIDDTGREKMVEMAINSTDLFFTWSDIFENYKDLNDYCVNENVWSINPDEIINRSFVGSKALVKI
jgi:hypothetical protein|tara:strand:+ start:3549 stop:4553 length:1005 start_codon:yes stop_codon:yes gene_type:complete